MGVGDGFPTASLILLVAGKLCGYGRFWAVAFCNPLEIKKCVEVRIAIGDLSDSLPPHSGNLPRREMKFLSLEAGFSTDSGRFLL
jgi:hypothetical protein